MVIRRAGDPPRSPPITPRVPRAARTTRARPADAVAHAGGPDPIDRLEPLTPGASVEHAPLLDASGEPPPRPDLAQLRVAEALERAQRRVAAEVGVLLDASASAERRRRAWRALERARHALSTARARAARARRAASADARGLSIPSAPGAYAAFVAALEAALAAAMEADGDAPPRRRARAALALALDHAAALDAGARDGVVVDLSAALVGPSSGPLAEGARDTSRDAPAALARLAALLGVTPLDPRPGSAIEGDAEDPR